MLTDRHRACLVYLSGVMEATGARIGEVVAPDPRRSSRGNAIIGNRIARELMFWSGGALVTYLPDLKCWRITRKGRQEIQ